MSLKKKELQDLDQIHHIKINFCQKLNVYLIDLFQFCVFHPDENKLFRLYTKGSDLLEKEMDIVKLIKHVRNINYFMKTQVDQNHKRLLKIQGKNVINLDHSDSQASS